MLSLDYETRCRLDLRKVGLDAYTAHESFRVLMAAYRIDRGPLQHWEVHERPIPADLKEALCDPRVEKWAFNASFERVVTERGFHLASPIEGWRCAMVLSYMQSFVGGLFDVGLQVGMPEDRQKKKTGRHLIGLFCQPQRLTKRNPHEWRDWSTDPDQWSEFCEYNKQDVVAEEYLRKVLIRYPVLQDEWDFYHLDQMINDRGLPVDLEFVRNVKAMSDRRQDELLSEMGAMTGLPNANSVAQLLPWLKAQGYPYDDIRKETVQKALARALELWKVPVDAPAVPLVVRVLQHRLWAARTSTKKAQAALLSAGAGDRIRNMYQFAGASRSGRFAGRLVQPQNLARTPKIFEDTAKLDCATDLIRRGDYDAFDLFVDEPMMVFAGLMRGMFRTAGDEEFHVCDYASVESAGLAWIAGCERLLNVFREGRDPYRDFGTLFYKLPYDEITKEQRNIGKAPSLGAGYGLGPGRIENGEKTGLLKYAESMGIDMDPETAEHAIRVYREGYPEIPQFWRDCQDAAFRVVQTRHPCVVGRIRFEYLKPYLLVRLPTGRHIYYFQPKLEQRLVKTGRVQRVYANGSFVKEEEESYLRTVFTCMGRNQITTRWERIEIRGSKFCENVVQALCRDILKVGMQRVHEAGFYIVGHAHDEIITISHKGDNRYTWERMRDVMCQPIDWAPGFPLAAGGWSGPYYRKA
jgi:DNA polymerase